MKKMIHVGILSVGLMLSNAALAETEDKFAHMRNSPNNMTAEQAEQVEAGFVLPLVREGAKAAARWGKNAWNAYQKSKYVKPATEKAAGAAGYYGAYRAGYNEGRTSD